MWFRVFCLGQGFFVSCLGGVLCDLFFVVFGFNCLLLFLYGLCFLVFYFLQVFFFVFF